MYLKRLRIVGFRCIRELVLDFCDGMNVLIGENDTGKTAVMDALRICLSLTAERREVYITSDDFHIDRSGQASDCIEFDVSFGDVRCRERGIFYELLAVSAADEPELQLHVRFTRDPLTERPNRDYWAGELRGQKVPSEVLGLFYFTYLGALRDASRDLTPRRGNQLSKLFLKLVPEHEERAEYERDVNVQLQSLPRLTELREKGKERINEHLARVSLRGSPQAVDIALVGAEFRDIVESFRIRVPFGNQPASAAEPAPPLDNEPDQALEIRQNGLGLNNIIYIATVLGDLRERRHAEPDSYISLLIEEPEAHLHPQLQNRLFAYLREIQKQAIQVFVTSHSPTITAKTDLDSVIVLTKSEEGITCTPLRNIDLEEKHERYLKRFLDVTKSQLFFAKGVILVEGISEALLIPTFARRMGDRHSLERTGVVTP